MHSLVEGINTHTHTHTHLCCFEEFSAFSFAIFETIVCIPNITKQHTHTTHINTQRDIERERDRERETERERKKEMTINLSSNH